MDYWYSTPSGGKFSYIQQYHLSPTHGCRQSIHTRESVLSHRRKRGEAAGKDRQMTLLVFTYCHLLPPTATTHYICTFIFGRRRVRSRLSSKTNSLLSSSLSGKSSNQQKQGKVFCNHTSSLSRFSRRATPHKPRKERRGNLARCDCVGGGGGGCWLLDNTPTLTFCSRRAIASGKVFAQFLFPSATGSSSR